MQNQDTDRLKPRATDTCQRFLFEGLDIRGELAHLTGSFRDVVDNNKSYPARVQILLGEFLTASVLLSSTVKFDGRLVLQARGEGQVPLIMAECNTQRHIRGIARYTDEKLSPEFRDLLSKATLAITLEPEQGEPYQGIVPLEGATLSSCLEDYFARSEQLNSRIVLGTSGNSSAGILIQQLPATGKKDSTVSQEEFNEVSSLLSTLTEPELLQLDNEELLYRLFHQFRVKLFPPRPIVHRCSCSRERTARALNAIGEDEVMAIIAEEGVVEVNCEFCARRYTYTEPELRLLFESPSPGQVH